MSRLAVAVVLAVAVAALTGCAAARKSSIVVSPLAETSQAASPAPAPAPLDRSLFVPRGGSGLSEADLGRILDAPLEMKLPARVGVAALGRAFEPTPPASLEAGLVATRALTEALDGSRLVTVATQMATEIPTGGGMEGLRELAARYRAPYLLLYSERFVDRTRANGFAALWPTVIGGLLTPSQTVSGEGVLSVSMLDVRSGTVLFTIQEAVSFQTMHLPIGAGAAWRELMRKAADKAAKELAARVLDKFQRVARADQAEEGPPPAAQATGSEVAPIVVAQP